jgi:hypothetical protein
MPVSKIGVSMSCNALMRNHVLWAAVKYERYNAPSGTDTLAVQV